MSADPVDGLQLVAAVRRAARRVHPSRVLLGLLRARLGSMLGFTPASLASMLPDSLAAKEAVVPAGYDLPPSHYRKKNYAADKIVACLLFEPHRINEWPLSGLTSDEVRGHVLADVLLASRSFGDPLEARIQSDDLAYFIDLYQTGRCHAWYLALYVDKYRRRVEIEVNFRAALMQHASVPFHLLET